MELLCLVLEFLCQRRKRIACICHLMHCRSLLLGGCRDGLRIVRCLARDILDALQRLNHIILCLADNTNRIRSKTDILTQLREVLRYSAERLTRGGDNRGPLIDVFIPLADGGNGVRRVLLDEADEVGDVLCRLARLLCELADFLCDDGESAACLTGTCCLDGGVEGEEIRLLGDPRDGIDDRTEPRQALPLH